MILWWNKLITVIKKSLHHRYFPVSLFYLSKKLLFRNIWYNMSKIIYWFMGKMIQVASWLNIIYLRYSTSSTFFMQSQPYPICYLSKYWKAIILALLCISCQCFGHRLLYYCQIVLALFFCKYLRKILKKKKKTP